MGVTLIHSVADFLGFAPDEVVIIAAKAQRTYRHYKIAKKRGGLRTIHHPSKETKSLQYALMSILESALQPHACAMAYRRGLSSPLRKNAELHSKYPFSLRVDFKDFFPSINEKDLFVSLEDTINPHRIILAPEDKVLLSNAFFTRNPNNSLGLPIGAPSSPLISNAVMRRLDTEIDKYAKTCEFIYTRYADDLIFSCQQKGVSKQFLDGLGKIIDGCQNPKIQINDAKTHFMSRNCRRVVTGVTIEPSGRLSIGRRRKRYIRKLINDFGRGVLDERTTHSLQGHLAFILDVEPGLYDRLCMKYGAPLLRRALSQRGDIRAN